MAPAATVKLSWVPWCQVPLHTQAQSIVYAEDLLVAGTWIKEREVIWFSG